MYGTGKLIVSKSTIAENDAADGYGGGVYSYDNDVAIKNSKLDGNAGDDGAGGFYLEASARSRSRTARSPATTRPGAATAGAPTSTATARS